MGRGEKIERKFFVLASQRAISHVKNSFRAYKLVKVLTIQYIWEWLWPTKWLWGKDKCDNRHIYSFNDGLRMLSIHRSDIRQLLSIQNKIAKKSAKPSV